MRASLRRTRCHAYVFYAYAILFCAAERMRCLLRGIYANMPHFLMPERATPRCHTLTRVYACLFCRDAF